MKSIRKKIKIFLISKLIKEDDENHLLFLNKNSKINKILRVGEMSSGIFHDLFTPITSLSLIIDKLDKDGVLDDHQLQASCIDSKNELNNLVKIIKDHLKESDVVEKIDISNLVEKSIKFLKYKIITNNIKISFIRKSSIIIKTKKLKLIQVMTNIISNSINSFEGLTKENKLISINVSQKKKYTYISIVDNGTGITKENIRKIYNPLFTTRDEGVGLGLSTTKNIVENELGGKIKISSVSNNGTKVLIKIPN